VSGTWTVIGCAITFKRLLEPTFATLFAFFAERLFKAALRTITIAVIALERFLEGTLFAVIAFIEEFLLERFLETIVLAAFAIEAGLFVRVRIGGEVIVTFF